MVVDLRDMREDDVDWVVHLLHTWDPSLPPAIWRRLVTGESAPMRRAIVAETEGERVGWAGVNDPEGLAYPLIGVIVAPGHWGIGIGGALFAELLPLVSSADVGAGLPDHDEHSLEVARHWGFEVLGHGIDSAVDLTNPPPHPALPDGVVLRALAGADVPASGLDVDAFLTQVGDFPEVYGSRLTNEILLQMAPDLVWVLLVDAEGVLAGSSLMPIDDGPWYIGFTGSAPRGRGRGYGRSVKLAAHRYAFDQGVCAVRTTNEERNERMRALNASMGYVKVSGDLRLIRRVMSQGAGN